MVQRALNLSIMLNIVILFYRRMSLVIAFHAINVFRGPESTNAYSQNSSADRTLFLEIIIFAHQISFP